MHLWASASVYSSEIPTKPLRSMTHPLTFANPTSKSTGPSSRLSLLLLIALSCRLPCSVSAFFCLLLWLLPSSSSGREGNLAHRPFASVSHQNGQRDPLICTHTHTHRYECHPSCHKFDLWHGNPSWVIFASWLRNRDSRFELSQK